MVRIPFNLRHAAPVPQKVRTMGLYFKTGLGHIPRLSIKKKTKAGWGWRDKGTDWLLFEDGDLIPSTHMGLKN